MEKMLLKDLRGNDSPQDWLCRALFSPSAVSVVASLIRNHEIWFGDADLQSLIAETGRRD